MDTVVFIERERKKEGLFFWSGELVFFCVYSPDSLLRMHETKSVLFLEIFQDWEDFLAMNMKQRFSWFGKKQQTNAHHCAIKKTN
jgi:hypothetical protein